MSRADRDGFAEFYAVQFRQIAAQLSVYLGDLDEARDVTQEAFVRAWQRWDRIAGYEEPAVWVRRVAWNLGTSRLRRWRVARRHQVLEVVAPVPGPEPHAVAIRAALAGLPDGQRRAVVLHYLVGLPVAEVADVCRVRTGTVRTWLYRARLTLAVSLRDFREVHTDAGL
ncbi:sigma-70 family RNA polymerase sigma factor [Dactylosporangium sp. NPDC000244]|uniref:RNA polymerase sigma factor n=1 Tax=Dactylosporangium sp. NPDC000244 TaxID=3154365 RepID=UPI00331E9571